MTMSGCTCFKEHGVGALRVDIDCPYHGDGANQPRPFTQTVCPWKAASGAACGRIRLARKETHLECPAHDHASLPGFQKGLRKH